MTTSATPDPLAILAVERCRVGRKMCHQLAIGLWVGFLERLYGRLESHHLSIVSLQ